MDILTKIGEFVVEIHREVFKPFLSIPTFNSGITAGDVCVMSAFIMAAIMLIVCDALILYGIYKGIHWITILIRTKEVRRSSVIGEVIYKEHIKEDSTFLWFLKPPVILDTSERNYVLIAYDGVEKLINNKHLYEGTEKGEKLNMVLVERLNKNGKIIKKTLKLPN